MPSRQTVAGWGRASHAAATGHGYTDCLHSATELERKEAWRRKVLDAKRCPRCLGRKEDPTRCERCGDEGEVDA
jgi:hypothetical protein